MTSSADKNSLILPISVADTSSDLHQPINSESHHDFLDNDDDGDDDELERQIAATLQSLPPRNGNENKHRKHGSNVLQFEIGNADDPWKNLNTDIDRNTSVVNADYQAPCSSCTDRLPYCCIVSCCCFWSSYDRRQCALALLYTKWYLAIYILSIVITVGLLVYDVSTVVVDLDQEPIYILIIDVVCIAMMVFDIMIQMQSSAGYKAYFASWLNVVDFVIVTICVVSVPVYWISPDWILSVVLLFRFIFRMLRILIVIRHQRVRKEYINARDSIVDFTKYNEQNAVKQAVTFTNEQFL